MSYFKNKNILITGGGGFLGLHLVEKLLSLGSKVRIAQRSQFYFESNILKKKIDYVKSDLTNLDDCKKAAKGINIIFDLASNVGSRVHNLEQPGTVFYQNVIISLNMLKAAAEENIERMLCTSSASVYSSSANLPFKEIDGFYAHPDVNFMGYGWAKRANELGANFFNKEFGLKICIARADNTYGPRASLANNKINILHYYMKEMIGTKDFLEIWSDGNQKRSFIFVKDVVDAMLVLVEKNKSFSTINVASGQILSVNELLKKLLKISGSKIKIKYNKSKKKMTPDRILDNSKLVQDFDWRPKFSIDDGLKLTYNWMKSQLL